MGKKVGEYLNIYIFVLALTELNLVWTFSLDGSSWPHSMKWTLISFCFTAPGLPVTVPPLTYSKRSRLILKTGSTCPPHFHENSQNNWNPYVLMLIMCVCISLLPTSPLTFVYLKHTWFSLMFYHTYYVRICRSYSWAIAVLPSAPVITALLKTKFMSAKKLFLAFLVFYNFLVTTLLF